MTDIKVLINDKELPLNEFIKDLVVNINMGIVKSLKAIPENIKSININIEL